MIMEQPAMSLAAAAVIPMLIYVMYSDLKDMRIPNMASLVIFAAFVPLGLWGLPIETFGWRVLHGAIAFFVAFGLFSVAPGVVGGGDLKLIVALVPYVPGDLLIVLAELWVVMSVVTLLLFVALRAGLRGRTQLAAIERSSETFLKLPFPYAWTIAGSFIAFLALGAAGFYEG